jgi:hypothetical protein
MESFIAVLELAVKTFGGGYPDYRNNVDQRGLWTSVLDAIEKHIAAEPTPSPDTLSVWTAAAIGLMNEYAMCEDEKKQLINIKQVITSHNNSLGDSIDMSLFSTCVPMVVITDLEEKVAADTNPSSNTLTEWAETINNLFRDYAMPETFAQKISQIMGKVTRYDPNFPSSIQFNLFSTSGVWPKKMLWYKKSST